MYSVIIQWNTKNNVRKNASHCSQVKVVVNQPCAYRRFHPSVRFLFIYFLCLLMDRTDTKRQKAGGGDDTQ